MGAPSQSTKSSGGRNPRGQNSVRLPTSAPSREIETTTGNIALLVTQRYCKWQACCGVIEHWIHRFQWPAPAVGRRRRPGPEKSSFQASRIALVASDASRASECPSAWRPEGVDRFPPVGARRPIGWRDGQEGQSQQGCIQTQTHDVPNLAKTSRFRRSNISCARSIILLNAAVDARLSGPFPRSVQADWRYRAKRKRRLFH